MKVDIPRLPPHSNGLPAASGELYDRMVANLTQALFRRPPIDVQRGIEGLRAAVHGNGEPAMVTLGRWLEDLKS